MQDATRGIGGRSKLQSRFRQTSDGEAESCASTRIARRDMSPRLRAVSGGPGMRIEDLIAGADRPRRLESVDRSQAFAAGEVARPDAVFRVDGEAEAAATMRPGDRLTPLRRRRDAGARAWSGGW